ncbi:MAG: DEAD/DEAH box helicase family protein [Sulfurimonas sp.]|nr:DEAD/DEAH box helicase family protein [Sulfurimonas sp.]
MSEFKLRPHQQKAVDDTISELAFGSNLAIINAPTSFGKSAVIAGLCRDLDGEYIVVLVNIAELIDQIAEHLKYLGIDYSILKSGRDSEFDCEKRIQIAMSQTLHSRIDKINLKCDIVIQDEIHREFVTSRTNDILDKLKPYSRIGLSATPFDHNNFKLDNAEIIHTLSILELQNQGYLSPIKYYIPRWSEKIDYSSVKSTGADYIISELDEVIATHKHIEQSIDSMNKLDAKNKKTIVFCSSIEQCESTTNELIKHGYKAGCTHSKMPSVDNENIIYAFKNGTEYISNENSKNNNKDKTLFANEDKFSGSEIKCLVSVSKLSVGFDVKDIQLGVIMRPTKVYSLFLQQVGRLVRTSKGKTHGEILDLAQCTSRFGFHTTPFSPLEKTGDKEIDKANKLALDIKMELPHLAETLDDDLVEFDFDRYKLSIKKLEAKEKSIQDKKNNISNWTMKELASAYDYTDNIFTIISIGAEIYIRKFGSPISKKGFPYEYDPKWITGNIFTAFEKYPEKKRQWLKAYKTRTRNIIKREQNFNALKFFIDFLVDKHESELYANESYKSIYQENKNSGGYHVPEIHIDEEDIPF